VAGEDGGRRAMRTVRRPPGDSIVQAVVLATIRRYL